MYDYNQEDYAQEMIRSHQQEQRRIKFQRFQQTTLYCLIVLVFIPFFIYLLFSL